MNNLPINQQPIEESFSQPTNAFRQNASPIAAETPALNNQEHSTTIRHATCLDSVKIAHEIYSIINDDNDLEKLNTCLENLRPATQEEIFSVLSQRSKNGENLLMSILFQRDLEMVKLLLPFYHLVSPENFQTLFLQQDRFGGNLLMEVIAFRARTLHQLENLELLLPFLKKISPENLEILLFQEDDDGDCLLHAIKSNDLEVLRLIVDLYTRVSPQVLDNAMQALTETQKESVEGIKMQINQRSTKNSRKT